MDKKNKKDALIHRLEKLEIYFEIANERLMHIAEEGKRSRERINSLEKRLKTLEQRKSPVDTPPPALLPSRREKNTSEGVWLILGHSSFILIERGVDYQSDMYFDHWPSHSKF